MGGVGLIVLSADNLAGTSLGLLGCSPWLAAPGFGAIRRLMALIACGLGRAPPAAFASAPVS